MRHRAMISNHPFPPLALSLLLFSVAASRPSPAQAAAVFRSTDGGRSWTRSDQGLPREVRLNAFGSVGDTLLAGTDAGIFVARRSGETWQPAVTNRLGRILAFATLGENVFAGTDRTGLLMSTNAGITWTIVPRFPAPHVRCLLAHQ